MRQTNKRALLAATAAGLFLSLSSCANLKNVYLQNSGINLPLEESRIVDISVYSKKMDMPMPCRIYLPKGYGAGTDYLVLYGLNAFGANEDMWINAGLTGSADLLIDSGDIPPLIMVFPFTKDWTIKEIMVDLEDGKVDEPNIDQFICSELVDYIDKRFDTIRSAKARSICGFSMGGEIALRTAFRHTKLFGEAGGYSPSVHSADYSDIQLEKWLFPNDDLSKTKNIVSYDKRKGLLKLSLYLYAGSAYDPFFAGVKSLQDALEKRGIKSEFHPYDGGHSLDHNNRDFGNYLRFFFTEK